MMEAVASPVSCPRLVGRDDELARVDPLLEAAGSGDGRVLLLGGDAGIGKTRLLGAIHDRARSRGFTVLSGGCVDLGAVSVPFTPVAQAVRQLRREVGDAAVQEVLGAAADDLAPLLPGLPVRGSGDQPEPGQVFEAIVALLEGLADSSPVVLSIEDAQWADQSTRDLLTLLVHTVTGTSVLLVVTFRTDDLHRRHPLRGFLADAERHPSSTRIDLAPLSRPEVDDLLTGIAGRHLDAGVLDSVWQRSEGNPFYAEELYIADGCCDVMPESLGDAMRARIARLTDEHQALLRVAAAVGREVDDALLDDLSDLPRDTYNQLLRDLVGDSILVPDDRGYRFRHALLQEVVYDELLPGERVALHRRIAERLTGAAGVERLTGGETRSTAGEVAHHWFQARRLPEALSASVEAGLAAEAMGAPADALAHFERALEVWDSVPDAADRSPLPWLELVEHAESAADLSGQFARCIALARTAVDAVDPAEDPTRAALTRSRLGRALFLADQPGSIEQLEEAVAMAPVDPPTRERALVLAVHAQLLMLMGRLDEGLVAGREALAVALQTGDRRVEGHARNTIGTVLSNQGDGDAGIAELRTALEIAKETGQPSDLGRAYVNLTHALSEHACWDEVLEVSREALPTMHRNGTDRTHGVYAEFNVIAALVAVGHWDDAAASERTLQSRLPSGHWGYFGVSAFTSDRGELDRARETIARAGSLPEHDTAVLQGLTTFTNARVALAIWEGRPGDVRAMVSELLDRLPPSIIGWETGQLLWRATWAEADLAQELRARRAQDGALELPRAVADEMLELGRQVLDPNAPLGGSSAGRGFAEHLALVVCERERLDDEDTVEGWLAAADGVEGVGQVFPATYARFRAAEVAVRDGDRKRAGELVHPVLEVARSLGAAPLLDRATSLVARARLDAATSEELEAPGASLGLSARERQVLELVAEGLTNRQIAEALYISPKTASVHVSNILAKLGVSGRVEAAAVAHRLGIH